MLDEMKKNMYYIESITRRFANKVQSSLEACLTVCIQVGLTRTQFLHASRKIICRAGEKWSEMMEDMSAEKEKTRRRDMRMSTLQGGI